MRGGATEAPPLCVVRIFVILCLMVPKIHGGGADLLLPQQFLVDAVFGCCQELGQLILRSHVHSFL